MAGATSGSALDVSNQCSITTAVNGGGITLIGDSMNLGGNVTVSANSSSTVTLRQKANGTAINLGGADASGTLGLTDAELDRVTAGTISIGDANSGTLTVSALIDRSVATVLNLTTASGNNIAFSGSGSLTSAGGNVTLTTSGA